MIGRYLKNAGIEINQTTLMTEIQSLVKDRFRNKKNQIDIILGPHIKTYIENYKG